MRSFREVAEEICECRRELEKISNDQSNLLAYKVIAASNEVNDALKKFEYFMMENE